MTEPKFKVGDTVICKIHKEVFRITGVKKLYEWIYYGSKCGAVFSSMEDIGVEEHHLIPVIDINNLED